MDGWGGVIDAFKGEALPGEKREELTRAGRDCASQRRRSSEETWKNLCRLQTWIKSQAGQTLGTYL